MNAVLNIVEVIIKMLRITNGSVANISMPCGQMIEKLDALCAAHNENIVAADRLIRLVSGACFRPCTNIPHATAGAATIVRMLVIWNRISSIFRFSTLVVRVAKILEFSRDYK